MTWHAEVDHRDEFHSRNVRVLVYRRLEPDGVEVLCANDTVRVLHAGERTPDDVGLRLPSDALHALLAALSRHLGAVEHPEALRRDYDAERGRVDRLIGALIERSAP